MPGIARYCEIYEEMEYPLDEPIRVYPNPASDVISFKTYLKISGITVLDITGKPVANLEPPNNQKQTQLPAELKGGLYFLLIQTNKGLKIERLYIRK